MEEDSNIEIRVEGSTNSSYAVDVDHADDRKDNVEDDQVVIDINTHVASLLSCITVELKKYSERFRPCHFVLVREELRKYNHEAYTPKVVSIGPFHRKNPHLQAMEEHKWRYLQKVLNRNKSSNSLKKFLEHMTKEAEQAQILYSRDLKLKTKEFVEMMLLDGCFIIQLFLQRGHYDEDDPIDRTSWMKPNIMRDLMLLENQIPFSVLESLWDLMIDLPVEDLREKALSFLVDSIPASNDPPSKSLWDVMIDLPIKALRETALSFLIHSIPASKSDNKPPPKQDGPEVLLYLLDLLHRSIKPAAAAPAKSQSTSGAAEKKHSPLQLHELIRGKILPFLSRKCRSFPKSRKKPRPPLPGIPSATELQEAGVKFQRAQDASSFLLITFDRGYMKMPCLSVDDDTDSLFRNLLAFEHYFCEKGNYVTSYCYKMDRLVNTARDVGILKQSEVLENWLGSDEEVALLFNNLCNGVLWDKENHLSEVLEQVTQHTQKRWPRYRVKLMRDYFSNPWSFISLFAAIFIIFLTSVQTYYAVFF